MVEDYLLSRDGKWLQNCIGVKDPGLRIVAMESNRLRWDSFVEGRSLSEWVSYLATLLKSAGSQMHQATWGKSFISKLFNITHKQWIFWNSQLHYCGKEGITLQQHREIMQCITTNMLTKPDELLPCHWYLILTNPMLLAGGSTASRQLRLSSMNTAKSTAVLANHRTLDESAVDYFNTHTVT